MNLPTYLPTPQIVAGEKAIAEKIEVQEIKDVNLIQVDKGEVQKPTHIVILQDIVSLPTGRNNLTNH